MLVRKPIMKRLESSIDGKTIRYALFYEIEWIHPGIWNIGGPLGILH